MPLCGALFATALVVVGGTTPGADSSLTVLNVQPTEGIDASVELITQQLATAAAQSKLRIVTHADLNVALSQERARQLIGCAANEA